MARNPLVLEGNLKLSENEGGFSSITVEVDWQELDVEIAKWAGVYAENNRGGNVTGEVVLVGKVRVTIKEID